MFKYIARLLRLFKAKREMFQAVDEINSAMEVWNKFYTNSKHIFTIHFLKINKGITGAHFFFT